MNIKYFIDMTNSPGEFLFIIDMMRNNKNIFNTNSSNIGIRINITENFEYCEDSIFVSDNFIKERIDYILKNKICPHSDMIRDRIQWDILKDELNINNLYIIFHINNNTIGTVCIKEEINRILSYKEWVIKNLLE